jgi:signal transduction histidine kinase
MAPLALLTALVMGLLVYRNLRATILPLENHRLAAYANRLAAELKDYADNARADVLAVANHAAVAGIARARAGARPDPRDATIDAEWRSRLASDLTAELVANPDYLQFRLIGVADGGREIVRAHRRQAGAAISLVPAGELQRKGDRDYFIQALRAPAGQIYISPIELNQEHGSIETPLTPVLRVATPVLAADGRPFGIVIVNVDMSSFLSGLRSAGLDGGDIYLANERGDYLAHPDPRREFGSELGRPARVQDDFPGLAGSLSLEEASVLEAHDADGQLLSVAVAPIQFPNGPRLVLLATVSYHTLTTSLASVRRSSLLAGLIVVAGALALALILARSLTRPLSRITAAVEKFRPHLGAERLAVPTEASGEIGILARAFERMSAEMQEKTDALKQEIAERRRVESEKEHYAEKLRRLSARSNTLIEEERKRIATEVHDRLGGNLVGFKHDLETIRRALTGRGADPGNSEVLAGISDLIGGVGATINTAKQIAEELRPAELDFLGLAPALRAEAQRFYARTGICCEVECEREESALAEEPALAVFRILQEALRNVYLHAATARVFIKFTENDRECVLEVRDEGRGVTEEEINKPHSLGLLGMRERAERVGGCLRVSGSAGRGTTLTAVIPVAGNVAVAGLAAAASKS